MIQSTPTNYSVPTSVASRDELDGTHKSNRYKQMIYEQVCLAGTNGMTCDEIEVKLGIRHQTASCFISVLKTSGAIVATGQTRPARSGRNVTVYTRKFSSVAVPNETELFQVKPTFRGASEETRMRSSRPVLGRHEMNHVDLFSGIGGFALAARNVWGKEYNNVCFCEINKYAQAVLRKNFGKDVVIIDDIRQLTSRAVGVGNNTDCCGRVHGKTKVKSAKGSHKAQREPIASVGSSGLRIDLLTGGFPCQPFSQAGARRGVEDDRFLWPEMLRVISEFRPTWIIGENVAGLLSMAEFDGESEVASETDLFGNRIDTHTKRGRGILFRIIGELEQIGYSVQTFVIPACAVNAPHRRDRVWIVAHRQGAKFKRERRATWGRRSESRCESWNENWLEIATRFCGVDDGLPGEMDGATLSKAGHRVERLKALGNAIVPQVAEQIMQAIKQGGL